MTDLIEQAIAAVEPTTPVVHAGETCTVLAYNPVPATIAYNNLDGTLIDVALRTRRGSRKDVRTTLDGIKAMRLAYER